MSDSPPGFMGAMVYDETGKATLVEMIRHAADAFNRKTRVGPAMICYAREQTLIDLGHEKVNGEYPPVEGVEVRAIWDERILQPRTVWVGCIARPATAEDNEKFGVT